MPLLCSISPLTTEIPFLSILHTTSPPLHLKSESPRSTITPDVVLTSHPSPTHQTPSISTTKGLATVNLGSIVVSFILAQGGKMHARTLTVAGSTTYRSRILRAVAGAVAGAVSTVKRVAGEGIRVQSQEGVE